jgi:hypothetical protein
LTTATPKVSAIAAFEPASVALPLETSRECVAQSGAVGGEPAIGEGERAAGQNTPTDRIFGCFTPFSSDYWLLLPDCHTLSRPRRVAPIAPCCGKPRTGDATKIPYLPLISDSNGRLNFNRTFDSRTTV